MLKLLRKTIAVSLAKFIIYKSVYVIHFVIITVSYLALVRLLFGELDFCPIKKNIFYTTILLYLSTAGLKH